ncbi:glucans biosynthesis glucosyltransferase MdoH [Wenzhouxiangella limi]|uniref:Glucans biosynthesis glucosyltransferase H n=1 Tax=Wenzhouxiangella limi TaxID=2707351 RepID=A0A845UVV9_9GAMM|nr:glucans biosynthesis glucosyltransferase MdoH [Wenzhouxiangella limi]NDY95607.1 glucans biosynthesis glucosyltransferase MdoH [Wenzhouxiangella limi]
MRLIDNFDLRRRLFLALVLCTGLLGLVGLFQALAAAGVDLFARIPLALLFALTFTWIAVSFWHAVIGFVLGVLRRNPFSLRPEPGPSASAPAPGAHRTALVVPIYNEDPAAVCSGIAAMAASLLASGRSQGFEFFVLSDTWDANILAAEQTAVADLQGKLGERLPLRYRHRSNNVGRKAGNLADFCRRWGRCYQFMLVLDADSRMDAASMLRLVATMQSDPRIGLIQTVPVPAGQHSLFARLMQFAAAVYSPMLATGQAFWQGRTANYWGHNALIRIPAFMASCGLPDLPGKPPLGGEILSHDFVESALLVRGGWSVVLDTAPLASHEEVPGNLVDYLVRDRRWMQGNLQHLRLLRLPGLHPASRVHFLFGACAFLSSIAWLGLIVLGLVTMLQHPAAAVELAAGAQTWSLTLLTATLGLLFGPRLLGLLLASLQRPQAFGGRVRLLASGVLEAVAGVLLAPVMMLFHVRFALEIVSGSSVGWLSPPRGDRGLTFFEALTRTGLASVFGLAWMVLAAIQTPQYLWWMSPVWLGLLLAPLLTWASSSRRLGEGLQAAGLLLTPAELGPAPALARGPVEAQRTRLGRTPAAPPPECPGRMPIQCLGHAVPDRHKTRYGRIGV